MRWSLPDWAYRPADEIAVRALPPPRWSDPVLDQTWKGVSRLAEVAAISAVGLLIVAIGFAGARADKEWADILFWGGLFTIVLPVAFRLLGRSASRRERMGLVVILTMLLYAVKVMHSPDGFTFHDEFGQYRGTEDILINGHLFTENPIVQVYSSFPGLAGATAAFASISGLSIFVSGLILVGAARLILAAALFGFLDKGTGSARIAGVAMCVYACNPNFLFFDAQFGYESLAIPLAAATLFVTSRAGEAREGRWPAACLAILLAGATVVTHHLTSYALVIALVGWAVAQRVRGRGSPRLQRSMVPLVAIGAGVLAAAWWLVGGADTGAQLGDTLSGAIGSAWDAITGTGSARAPFSGNPGYTDPPLERTIGLIAVGLLLATLPIGLWAIWKIRRRHAVMIPLGLVAAAYPATLAIRLGAQGAETSNRTSEFVFVGLGVGLGAAFARWVVPRVHGTRISLVVQVSFALAIGLLFAGGLTVGWPSQARIPGPYQVGGGSRAIDDEDVAAAYWARQWLPDRSTILADYDNSTLMGSYGHQDPQGGQVGGRQVGSMYFTTSLQPRDVKVIRADKIAYVVIDERMSTALPRSGRYFGSGEPRAYSEPPTPKALRKFDDDPRIDLIYSGGNMVIYDTSGLLRSAEGSG